VATDLVRRIADAVLYEGYLLWPYRKSALKNQQRFTFGGVYPPAWEDRSSMQVQVLLQEGESGTRREGDGEGKGDGGREGDGESKEDKEGKEDGGDKRGKGGEDVDLEIRVRFLQVVRRQVLRIVSPSVPPEPVEELEVDGERWVSWEEAVERELTPGPIRLPAGEQMEEIAGRAIRRSWQALEGEVTVIREVVHPGLSRLTVRVTNTTPWVGNTRKDALRQTFCSTHIVLRARSGAWVSPTDPPAALRAEAEVCESSGVWPVLVGEEGDRSTMLASPIILCDHPQIAPESPGDLFDSGEIDQMLVLNILAMSDEERRDMRDCDPRAREILERTEALSSEEIMRLHGAVREFGLVRAR
jgi:hypothetical protein